MKERGVHSSYIGCVNNEWCCMRSLSLFLSPSICVSLSLCVALIYEALEHQLSSSPVYYLKINFNRGRISSQSFRQSVNLDGALTSYLCFRQR